MSLPWNEIGGGFVARSFINNGKRLDVGVELDAEAIKSLNNSKTLIRAGFLKIYPPRGAANSADAHKTEAPTRHVVHNGGGRFDVIAGVKLNDGILTREEAEALAARSD